MIIDPSIRSNIFLNAHPKGCEMFVQKQIEEVKQLPTFNGPKNVLIIGGSSGYGLASRIALAYGASSNTFNVSYETPPKGKRTGTAGWWNNLYFQKFAKDTNHIHKDFVGDAFSNQMKELVADAIENTFKTVDLVIYSLAAGARFNEETQNLVRSSIKTIGEEAQGKTIDLADLTIKDLIINPATEEEIKDTVYVMGGSDWKDWIDYLDQRKLLSPGFKTISYTYIGAKSNAKIYREGTLGQAKEDLEEKARQMNLILKDKYDGEALISSSKAVVTKASVFIPKMPIYVSCLIEVMKKNNMYETILEHKYRLFKDMVYGNNRILDEKNRLRLDHDEMREDIQKETIQLMDELSDDKLFDLQGTYDFIKEFHQIHGFKFDEIDYDEDIDLELLANQFVLE